MAGGLSCWWVWASLMSFKANGPGAAGKGEEKGPGDSHHFTCLSLQRKREMRWSPTWEQEDAARLQIELAGFSETNRTGNEAPVDTTAPSPATMGAPRVGVRLPGTLGTSSLPASKDAHDTILAAKEGPAPW